MRLSETASSNAIAFRNTKEQTHYGIGSSSENESPSRDVPNLKEFETHCKADGSDVMTFVFYGKDAKLFFDRDYENAGRFQTLIEKGAFFGANGSGSVTCFLGAQSQDDAQAILYLSEDNNQFSSGLTPYLLSFVGSSDQQGFYEPTKLYIQDGKNWSELTTQQLCINYEDTLFCIGPDGIIFEKEEQKVVLNIDGLTVENGDNISTVAAEIVAVEDGAENGTIIRLDAINMLNDGTSIDLSVEGGSSSAFIYDNNSQSVEIDSVGKTTWTDNDRSVEIDPISPGIIIRSSFATITISDTNLPDEHADIQFRSLKFCEDGIEKEIYYLGSAPVEA